MPLVIPADVDPRAIGIYNVKNFGASGTGTSDDTTYIQSAINAAFLAGGGIVYLPSGTYLIDGGPITHGTKPGHVPGVTCSGIGPLPTGVVFALNNNYIKPNCPASLGTGGTLPANTLPNGPILLFSNITLMGDGPEKTILLAGPNIYGGWHFSPTGTGSTATIQLGLVIATMNYWADYASDLTDFSDGYFAKNVYVKDLSINCQGSLGINAGLPSNVIGGGGPVPNPAIATAQDGSPQGQLYGAAISLKATLNCGVDNVWVYNGNVNGIVTIGTLNTDAFTNGPLPQSFQQYTSAEPTFSPNMVNAVNPTGILSTRNVPTINGSITNCRADMNYPVWLAGSYVKNQGGSMGQLPIRSVGAASILAAFNRVGQRNQPSNFPTPMPGYSNPPNVSPNTNDALDCPGSWHVVVLGNVLTNCGDGIGADGNGDMIVVGNTVYNFGAIGFYSNKASGKAGSQITVLGNSFFLGSDFGTPLQQAIFVLDALPAAITPVNEAATATPGSVVIANNVFYGSAYNVMVELQALGVTVIGNVFDFGGVQPRNQPNPTAIQNTTGIWPVPNGAGVQIEGNDIIIEGNMFRNAGAPGTPNSNAIGIHFPSAFPPSYIVPPETIRVLIKGNIFDKTIGQPIQDNSSGSDGLFGVRILDNIGVNPVGSLNVLLVPFPSSGVPFANPYPYDCSVTISSGVNSISITLNGVVTGSSIAPGNDKTYLVKAGGTITLTYTGLPSGTWVWVGL